MRRSTNKYYHQWLIMLTFLLFISATLSMPYANELSREKKSARENGNSHLYFQEPNAPIYLQHQPQQAISYNNFYGHNPNEFQPLTTQQFHFTYGDNHEQLSLPTTVQYVTLPYNHPQEAFNQHNYIQNPPISYQNIQRPPDPFIYSNPFIQHQIISEHENNAKEVNEIRQHETLDNNAVKVDLNPNEENLKQSTSQELLQNPNELLQNQNGLLQNQNELLQNHNGLQNQDPVLQNTNELLQNHNGFQNQDQVLPNPNENPSQAFESSQSQNQVMMNNAEEVPAFSRYIDNDSYDNDQYQSIFDRKSDPSDHPDFAPIPTQDVGEDEEEDEGYKNNPNIPTFNNLESQHQDDQQRSELEGGAYSYHNVVLNPYEQKLPEMGFIFFPTILRVQQPHLILNELRRFKIQLDNSPIMNALFSPATVPIPPVVPWPSKFAAQQYLPPPEVFSMANHSSEKVIEETTSKPMDDEEAGGDLKDSMRRSFLPKMPTADSIEKSIKESMEKVNQDLFSSAFKFPAMPDFSKALDGIISAQALSKSPSSLVQIGNNNKNINNNGKQQLQISTDEEENKSTTEDPNETTTLWPGDLKVMNQVMDTTTSTNDQTTIMADMTESTISNKETTTMSDVTTTNNPLLTTTFDSLTTTSRPDETTTDSTEETSTLETTTFEIDDRIDPKVIQTLLG